MIDQRNQLQRGYKKIIRVRNERHKIKLKKEKCIGKYVKVVKINKCLYVKTQRKEGRERERKKNKTG